MKGKLILSRMFGLLGAALALCAAPLPVRSAPATPLYSITDLGPGKATGINAARQVIGIFRAVGGKDAEGKDFLVDHAFLWEKSRRRDLGTIPLPPGVRDFIAARANGINGRGQIVGAMGSFKPLFMSGLGDAYPFLYSQSRMRLLDRSLESWEAKAINNRGWIVGWGEYRAFLWRNGRVTTLGTLSHVPAGNRSGAEAINDRGQIVGGSTINRRVGVYFLQHAFLWQSGKMRDLGALPGDRWSQATGINNKGQVVGLSRKVTTEEDVREPGRERAFVWGKGGMTDLKTLGGLRSFAAGINNRGQIVGKSTLRPGSDTEHACLWSGGKLYDLNALIPKNSGWVLARAAAINDGGDIVGTGTLHGEEHAFLLTPTSP